jgi:hypothetical protein
VKMLAKGATAWDSGGLATDAQAEAVATRKPIWLCWECLVGKAGDPPGTQTFQSNQHLARTRRRNLDE